MDARRQLLQKRKKEKKEAGASAEENRNKMRLCQLDKEHGVLTRKGCEAYASI